LFKHVDHVQMVGSRNCMS